MPAEICVISYLLPVTKFYTATGESFLTCHVPISVFMVVFDNYFRVTH